MDSIDNMYLFWDIFEEKVSKVVTSKQKSNPSSLTYMGRRNKVVVVVIVWIVSPFSRALCINTSKVVEGEDSCSQAQLTEEVNFYLKNQNF